MYMKYQIDKLIILFSLLLGTTYASAQVDPALTATVKLTSDAEKSVLNDIKSNQSKIAGFQAMVTADVKIIRDYEEKMYSYLNNVSGAVKNAVEIKQAAQLTSDILTAFTSCLNAAKKNPQGVVVTGLVNKQISKCTTEMIGIYSYISSLVLSKETLLNSAERNQIMWTVLYKLRLIRSDIMLLQFQIEQWTLTDLPYLLFPMEYFYVIDGKRIADKIIKDFSKL